MTPRPASALLEYVVTHPIDEDYAAVAAARGRDGVGRRRAAGPRRPWVGTGLVLLVFGVLASVAGVQAALGEASVERGRAELVTQIESRRAALAERRERAARLRVENARQSGRQLALATELTQARARLTMLDTVTGLGPVTGPGVRVVVDDKPGAVDPRERVLDKDLAKLVNALWAAGAEAIAVDGVRLTSLTAIRYAGRAITVGYRSIKAPYTVLAIGDQGDLQARFVDTTHGQTWLSLHATVGLVFEMTGESSLRLPAARPLVLRYAVPTTDSTKDDS